MTNEAGHQDNFVDWMMEMRDTAHTATAGWDSGKKKIVS